MGYATLEGGIRFKAPAVLPEQAYTLVLRKGETEERLDLEAALMGVDDTRPKLKEEKAFSGSRPGELVFDEAMVAEALSVSCAFLDYSGRPEADYSSRCELRRHQGRGGS